MDCFGCRNCLTHACVSFTLSGVCLRWILLTFSSILWQYVTLYMYNWPVYLLITKIYISTSYSTSNKYKTWVIDGFYQTTVVQYFLFCIAGRIINRFSKDLDIVDSNMPIYIRQWLFALAPVITTICLISYTTPVFVAIVVFVLIMFIILQVSLMSHATSMHSSKSMVFNFM